ncbi:putative rapid response to glucose protein 1 [Phaeomoniella chlamydospora]|uniref:Putative rapid response to glucose protein 1 n=1 Tax=Phaeomoniella chlamydospora TaxID=158046 RepID=A0A0G2DRL1_PHACM|nr:putative rapid response to glucose protein 1 [Phaeomoniella chlamydospora]
MADRSLERKFSIPLDNDNSIDLRIGEPALRAEGLSFSTWTSSFVLASLLHKLDVDLSNPTEIPVLELGAGTGLVGLTAAILWRTSAVLTDLSPFVPGLANNIALNAALISAPSHVDCGSLDWAQPGSLTFQDGKTIAAKSNVILAADTIYSEEHPALLSNAILQWLAPDQKSRVILTYPLRVAYLDQLRELWQLLEDGGLEAISEGKEQASTDVWDDECLCEWSVWRWKKDAAST